MANNFCIYENTNKNLRKYSFTGFITKVIAKQIESNTPHSFQIGPTHSHSTPLEEPLKIIGSYLCSIKQTASINTQHYAKIFNNKIGEDMKVIKDKGNF